jgi:SPP1 family predicted phage head-tail adaptor
MTMIRAGELRNLVTIQEPSNTATDGYESDTYSTLTTLWMRIRPLTGREFFEGRAILSEHTFRFKGRYVSGITARHRLVWDGDTYKIVSPVNPEKRNKELEIVATLIEAGG